jgi:predicted DNA binding protein
MSDEEKELEKSSLYSGKMMVKNDFLEVLKSLGVDTGKGFEIRGGMNQGYIILDYKGSHFIPKTDKTKKIYKDLLSSFINPSSSTSYLRNTLGILQVRINEEKELSAEEERKKAMEIPKIEEEVKDFSDRYGVGVIKGGGEGGQGLHTGTGVHVNVGEKAGKSKITDKQASDIRRRYWTGKVDKTKRITQEALAKEYGMGEPTISGLINRYYYSHIPLVENEPKEYLDKPNATQRRVLTRVRKAGKEALIGKGGGARLPDELVLAGRKKPEEK